MGKKHWRTYASSTPGKNLSWSESFHLVIEAEKELLLEIVDGDQLIGEECIGSSLINLKQIKSGTSPNKIPIMQGGQSLGFLVFQTEYQIPQINSSANLDESTTLGSYGASNAFSLKNNGKLIISTIRVFLEKSISVEDAYVMVQWGSSIEKSSVKFGQQQKPEWRELLVFSNSIYENKLEVKLLDKNSKSEDDVVGYGLLLLDPSAADGGKFRSQKIELKNEESLSGYMYLDLEYQLDNQRQKDLAKNDPLDMKKKTKPTLEEIKKKEMLQKRKDLMKASYMTSEKNRSFLPQIEENSSILRLRSPQRSPQKSPQPKAAVKTVHMVSLPQIGYDIKVKEYNRLYKDSVFGLGMSNVHSAQSLRHSIPSFSLSKADRFPQRQYDGFDSLHYSAPSNFNGGSESYKYLKNKIYTPDNRYEIFHRSPQQKAGVSFGVGKRFEIKKDSSPGYYQGPQLLNYNE